MSRSEILELHKTILTALDLTEFFVDYILIHRSLLNKIYCKPILTLDSSRYRHFLNGRHKDRRARGKNGSSYVAGIVNIHRTGSHVHFERRIEDNESTRTRCRWCVLYKEWGFSASSLMRLRMESKRSEQERWLLSFFIGGFVWLCVCAVLTLIEMLMKFGFVRVDFLV